MKADSSITKGGSLAELKSRTIDKRKTSNHRDEHIKSIRSKWSASKEGLSIFFSYQNKTNFKGVKALKGCLYTCFVF